MELSDIKRGDILVAEYNDIKHERNYIIFIASGSNISIGFRNMNHTNYIIPTIAFIGLSNTLTINNPLLDYGRTIGFIVHHKDTYKTTKIRKPTFEETLELMNRLKENGYKYNRKTKNIEKL